MHKFVYNFFTNFGKDKEKIARRHLQKLYRELNAIAHKKIKTNSQEMVEIYCFPTKKDTAKEDIIGNLIDKKNIDKLKSRLNQCESLDHKIHGQSLLIIFMKHIAPTDIIEFDTMIEILKIFKEKDADFSIEAEPMPFTFLVGIMEHFKLFALTNSKIKDQNKENRLRLYKIFDKSLSGSDKKESFLHLMIKREFFLKNTENFEYWTDYVQEICEHCCNEFKIQDDEVKFLIKNIPNNKRNTPHIIHMLTVLRKWHANFNKFNKEILSSGDNDSAVKAVEILLRDDELFKSENSVKYVGYFEMVLKVLYYYYEKRIDISKSQLINIFFDESQLTKIFSKENQKKVNFEEFFDPIIWFAKNIKELQLFNENECENSFFIRLVQLWNKIKIEYDKKNMDNKIINVENEEEKNDKKEEYGYEQYDFGERDKLDQKRFISIIDQLLIKKNEKTLYLILPWLSVNAIENIPVFIAIWPEENQRKQLLMIYVPVIKGRNNMVKSLQSATKIFENKVSLSIFPADGSKDEHTTCVSLMKYFSVHHDTIRKNPEGYTTFSKDSSLLDCAINNSPNLEKIIMNTKCPNETLLENAYIKKDSNITEHDISQLENLIKSFTNTGYDNQLSTNAAKLFFSSDEFFNILVSANGSKILDIMQEMIVRFRAKFEKLIKVKTNQSDFLEFNPWHCIIGKCKKDYANGKEISNILKSGCFIISDKICVVKNLDIVKYYQLKNKFKLVDICCKSVTFSDALHSLLNSDEIFYSIIQSKDGGNSYIGLILKITSRIGGFDNCGNLHESVVEEFFKKLNFLEQSRDKIFISLCSIKAENYNKVSVKDLSAINKFLDVMTNVLDSEIEEKFEPYREIFEDSQTCDFNKKLMELNEQMEKYYPDISTLLNDNTKKDSDKFTIIANFVPNKLIKNEALLIYLIKNHPAFFRIAELVNILLKKWKDKQNQSMLSKLCDGKNELWELVLKEKLFEFAAILSCIIEIKDIYALLSKNNNDLMMKNFLCIVQNTFPDNEIKRREYFKKFLECYSKDNAVELKNFVKIFFKDYPSILAASILIERFQNSKEFEECIDAIKVTNDFAKVNSISNGETFITYIFKEHFKRRNSKDCSGLLPDNKEDIAKIFKKLNDKCKDCDLFKQSNVKAETPFSLALGKDDWDIIFALIAINAVSSDENYAELIKKLIEILLKHHEGYIKDAYISLWRIALLDKIDILIKIFGQEKFEVVEKFDTKVLSRIKDKNSKDEANVIKLYISTKAIKLLEQFQKSLGKYIEFLSEKFNICQEILKEIISINHFYNNDILVYFDYKSNTFWQNVKENVNIVRIACIFLNATKLNLQAKITGMQQKFFSSCETILGSLGVITLDKKDQQDKISSVADLIFNGLNQHYRGRKNILTSPLSLQKINKCLVEFEKCNPKHMYEKKNGEKVAISAIISMINLRFKLSSSEWQKVFSGLNVAVYLAHCDSIYPIDKIIDRFMLQMQPKCQYDKQKIKSKIAPDIVVKNFLKRVREVYENVMKKINGALLSTNDLNDTPKSLIEELKSYADKIKIEKAKKAMKYDIVVENESKMFENIVFALWKLTPINIRLHYTQLTAIMWLLLGSNNEHNYYEIKQKDLYAQIKSGQGKSLVIGIIATYLVFFDYQVHIFTHSNNLAKRDALGILKNFYEAMEIKVGIWDRGDIPDGNIIYTTNEHIAYTTNKKYEKIFDGAELFKSSKKKILIMDETDVLMVDNKGNADRYLWSDFAEVNSILKFIHEKKGECNVEEIKEKFSLFKKSKNPSNLHKAKLEYLDEKLNCFINSYRSAQRDYRKDVDYVISDVSNHRICLKDKNTGTIQNSSVLPDGIHQFLQMRHKIPVTPYSLVGNVILFSDVLKNEYMLRLGVTGSIGDSNEMQYLSNVYNDGKKIPILKVPRFSDQSKINGMESINIVEKNEWLSEIVSRAKDISNGRNPRPVLIVMENEEDVKLLESKLMKANNIQYLSAKEDLSKEEHLIEKTGMLVTMKDNKRFGMITVCTKYGGRGQDYVVLGADAEIINSNGGMHVIICFFPETKRLEIQIKGRTARQDGVGSYQFILFGTKRYEDLVKSRKSVNSKMQLDSYTKNVSMFCAKFFKQYATTRSGNKLKFKNTEGKKLLWCFILNKVSNELRKNSGHNVIIDKKVDDALSELKGKHNV